MRIREIREARRLSRKTFSNQIGYAEVTVGRWEREERNPDAKALRIMSDVLACSVDDLVADPPLPRRRAGGKRRSKEGEGPAVEAEDLKATA